MLLIRGLGFLNVVYLMLTASLQPPPPGRNLISIISSPPADFRVTTSMKGRVSPRHSDSSEGVEESAARAAALRSRRRWTARRGRHMVSA